MLSQVLALISTPKQLQTYVNFEIQDLCFEKLIKQNNSNWTFILLPAVLKSVHCVSYRPLLSIANMLRVATHPAWRFQPEHYWDIPCTDWHSAVIFCSSEKRTVHVLHFPKIFNIMPRSHIKKSYLNSCNLIYSSDPSLQIFNASTTVVMRASHGI